MSEEDFKPSQLLMSGYNPETDTATITPSELKPCPFCGEIPRAAKYDFTTSSSFPYFIECRCGVATDGFATQEESIKCWNTRADHFPEAGKMVEEENTRLKELLRWCRDNMGLGYQFVTRGALQPLPGDGDRIIGCYVARALTNKWNTIPDCPEKAEIEKILEEK